MSVLSRVQADEQYAGDEKLCLVNTDDLRALLRLAEAVEHWRDTPQGPCGDEATRLLLETIWAVMEESK